MWAHGNGYQTPMCGNQRPAFLVEVTVADGLIGSDCGQGYSDEKMTLMDFKRVTCNQTSESQVWGWI